MSAIVGRLNRNGAPLNSAELAAMLQVSRPLGLDGQERYHQHDIALGCNLMNFRTSNKPSTNSQPYTRPYQKQGCVIVADVQLLNKTNLARKLELTSCTERDEVLILAAYLRWGEACPQHLLGSFAFAIWDAKLQTLFCAVDHCGSRNICFHLTETSFVFATEVKALFQARAVPCKPSERYLAQYLIDTQEDGQTAYEGIQRMLPAQTISISRSRVQRRHYWDPLQAPDLRLSGLDAHVQMARQLLRDIFQERTTGCANIGLMTGGGLNTALALAAIADNPDGQPTNLTAVAYAPPLAARDPRNENAYIQALADYWQIPLQLVWEDTYPAPFGPRLEKRFYALDAPTVNPIGSDYDALNAAFEQASCRITMNFSDADMLLSWGATGTLPTLLKTAQWRPFWRLFKRTQNHYPHSPLRLLVSQALRPIAQEFLNLAPTPSHGNGAASSYLRSELIERHQLAERAKHHHHFTATETPWDHRRIRLAALTRLCTYQHRKHAQERAYPHFRTSPFLDKRLIEFCMQIPPALFLQGPLPRSFARTLLQGRAPATVLQRNDRSPFPADLAQRRKAMVAALLQQLKTLPNNALVWQFADHQRVKEATEKLKANTCNDTAPTKKSIHRLARVVILERYLKWHATGRKPPDP